MTIGHNGFASDLRNVMTEGRLLVEEQMDLAEKVAGLRDAATAKGLDWSQIKALLKAVILDDRDEKGSGKHVKRLLEKASNATAYADMIGLGEAIVNEKNYSAPPHDAITGEIIEQEQESKATATTGQPPDSTRSPGSGPVEPGTPSEQAPAPEPEADTTGTASPAPTAVPGTPGDPSEGADSGIDYFHIPDFARRTV